MEKYVVGVDFGTLSARAVIASVKDGTIYGESTSEYRHAVIDKMLPGNIPLGKDWALQYPADYIRALKETVGDAVRKSGIKNTDIIGIGIDFTSNTILPLDKEGVPLCERKDMADNPHAYAKLWKHHATQKEADLATEIAVKRKESFLKRYGNKISSEWMLPKIMQILNEAPEIYEKTDRFVEAADYITERLTGRRSRCNSCAGYKNLYSEEEGYPSEDFFYAIDPRLKHIVREKFPEQVLTVGSLAGYINAGSPDIGLAEGTAVAVPTIDAHVAVPAVGISGPGQLLMIMGTSGCDIICDSRQLEVKGICGCVKDGVLPGYYGYESGQSGMGDIYDWFAKNCVPQSYTAEAEKRSIPIQSFLTEKAEKLKPGETGLLALDWWNGNRSVLSDSNLSGLILGLNLNTKPEEIYRALIEATAFGKRRIIENYSDSGIAIESIYACGGITSKNSMLMQIFSDVLNREIKCSAVKQTGAFGAAMLAACAAGKAKGGWDTIYEAINAMSKKPEKIYKPIPENVEIYDRLYKYFLKLHDWFGIENSGFMKDIKAMSKK